MEKEIAEFCEQEGLPPRIMPLKMDFVRANRYDLAHVVERWGGLSDLAELLEYQARLLPYLGLAQECVTCDRRGAIHH